MTLKVLEKANEACKEINRWKEIKKDIMLGDIAVVDDATDEIHYYLEFSNEQKQSFISEFIQPQIDKAEALLISL